MQEYFLLDSTYINLNTKWVTIHQSTRRKVVEYSDFLRLPIDNNFASYLLLFLLLFPRLRLKNLSRVHTLYLDYVHFKKEAVRLHFACLHWCFTRFLPSEATQFLCLSLTKIFVWPVQNILLKTVLYQIHFGMIVSATAPVTLEFTFKINFINVYNIFLTQTVIKRKVWKQLGLKFVVKLNSVFCRKIMHYAIQQYSPNFLVKFYEMIRFQSVVL